MIIATYCQNWWFSNPDPSDFQVYALGTAVSAASMLDRAGHVLCPWHSCELAYGLFSTCRGLYLPEKWKT